MSRTAPSGVTPAGLPPGLRVYAIGDIHGRRDLLDRLADVIADDLRERPCSEPCAVFVGDYVDRGMQSRAVVERLASGDFPAPIIALRGNHEAVLLDFLEDETVLDDWRRYGGVETLLSYMVDVSEVRRGRGFKAAQEAFKRNLPPAHLDFLQRTKLFHDAGGYFFCHAGVRPGILLARQNERDLLWIRYEFLNWPEPHEKIVVHGHTPVDEPESLANRINVDTGAYATGTLTCVALEESGRRFLST